MPKNCGKKAGKYKMSKLMPPKSGRGKRKR